MIRTLFIIAGAALVLCVVTVGGSLALGGHDLQRHGWAWTFKDDDGKAVRFERVEAGTDDFGPTARRTLAWTGGSTLQVDAGVDVEYVQGDTASVVVTGPQRLVDRVTFKDGVIGMSGGEESVIVGWRNGELGGQTEREGLRVVVTAPNVSRFVANGSGDLTLRNYDQPSLTLDIAGSSDVSASGQAQRLNLDIAGSGDADLASLTLKDAKIDIAGSGEATVAATGTVDVAINGSGDVNLALRPAKLNSSISGSGEVHQN